MAKSTSKLFDDDKKKPLSSMDGAELESDNNIVDMPAPSKEDDIQDIDLKITSKKRFRINGDNNKILELNTSDLSIITRLDSGYTKLNQLMEEVANELSVDEPEASVGDQLHDVSEALNKLDQEMRVQIDYIFDSNVSEICASDGSMWDPIDGAFRYEHIISVLSDLYENNLAKEFSAMRSRVSKHTSKYKKVVGASRYHK